MKQIFMTLALLLMAATKARAEEANIGSITYNSTLEAYEIKNANNLNDLAVYVNGTGVYTRVQGRDACYLGEKINNQHIELNII